MERIALKSGVTHNIRPNIDYETSFNDIAISAKIKELLGSYENSEDAKKVIEDVLEWGVNIFGYKELIEYLATPPCDFSDVVKSLVGASSDYERDLWQYYYELPSLNARFEHIANLKSKYNKITEVIGNQVKFYPIAIPYKDIFLKHMPAFQYDDAITERITHPFNSIAKLNNGSITVDTNLLQAIRGKYKAMPPGIDYKNTLYNDLHANSNSLGNFGLMLIGENLQSRQELKEISRASRVDCLSAGLSEGIAIAKTGLLRIGDVIGLPKYIPNTKGDYYCGINVKLQYTNNPYDRKPEIYYSLWTQEGSQNCLLAVT